MNFSRWKATQPSPPFPVCPSPLIFLVKYQEVPVSPARTLTMRWSRNDWPLSKKNSACHVTCMLVVTVPLVFVSTLLFFCVYMRLDFHARGSMSLLPLWKRSSDVRACGEDKQMLWDDKSYCNLQYCKVRTIRGVY